MGLSPIVTIVGILVCVVALILLWWLRYSQKKSVARNVIRQPHPYLGRMANNIYRIPLSRNYVYQTPPPTFSKAVSYPMPKRVSVNIQIEDVPPPTYQQYIKSLEVSEKQTDSELHM